MGTTIEGFNILTKATILYVSSGAPITKQLFEIIIVTTKLK